MGRITGVVTPKLWGVKRSGDTHGEAGGEWMMRWERDRTDQKRGDGQMSGDEERAKGSEPHRTVRWRTDGRMTQQEGGGGAR
jgi:hypothetical protein